MSAPIILYEFWFQPKDRDRDLVMQSILAGGFTRYDPVRVELGALGNGLMRRPKLWQFRVEMESGLVAWFRPETEVPLYVSKRSSIPPGRGSAPPREPDPKPRVDGRTQPERQALAFQVSLYAGIEIVPMSAIRVVGTLGRGSLWGSVDGKPFIGVETRTGHSVAHRLQERSSVHLCETMVFDWIIGSGQHAESSYRLDAVHMIRAQYHHEAFSFIRSDRLEEIIRLRGATVGETFLDAIVRFASDAHLIDRLTLQIRMDLGATGLDAATRFEENLLSVTKRRMVGITPLKVIR